MKRMALALVLVLSWASWGSESDDAIKALGGTWKCVPRYDGDTLHKATLTFDENALTEEDALEKKITKIKALSYSAEKRLLLINLEIKGQPAYGRGLQLWCESGPGFKTLKLRELQTKVIVYALEKVSDDPGILERYKKLKETRATDSRAGALATLAKALVEKEEEERQMPDIIAKLKAQGSWSRGIDELGTKWQKQYGFTAAEIETAVKAFKASDDYPKLKKSVADQAARLRAIKPQ